MRILFLGDVAGRSGRDGVKRHLPALKERLRPDVVIINAENAAAGFGITDKLAQEFFALGATCLTTGNHVWAQRELVSSIDREPRLLRPLNFREGTPGHGSYLHALPDGRKILIVNVLARLFMESLPDDPFAAAEKLLSQHRLGQTAQAVFVDFHGEATSEKMAFAHVFDGRVSAVIGTHTHIPTADQQILTRGTAYQSDAGMCGDYDSVIGVKKELAIWRFTRNVPGERFASAEGEATVCGCFVETNDASGLATNIARVQIGGKLQETLPDAVK
ncbi:MAG: TIGR00282 family metallophosphoesterase [Alphaproteobacteria bacterium]|nr:TIGR00282 family metallophosphoesterase [Alphaproteobacteria bacterium]